MLPTHNKGKRGLQSALDKSLTMAGMHVTKAGSGEKERAYIVRQNWVLKTMLLLIVTFAIGMMVLFSTVLKVSVTRREAMKAEKIHHQLEHQAQVKLMRAHLELQRALEQEVHETSRLEEFRSAADRAIGDHAASVKANLKAKGVDEAILKEIETADDKLRENLDMRMHHVLQHFQNVANNARNSLKRVAHAIVSDAELEHKEANRYKEKMKKNYGVDVDENEKRDPKEADEYGLFDEEADDDDDDLEIAEELERFFAKLKSHNFPLLPLEVIEDWEKDMHDVMRTLEDEDKEVDLEQIRVRVGQKIAMHAPEAPKFDSSVHNSIVDYYEMRIEEAKLAFHRQSLLDLYNGWKEDGKISPLTVMSGLEHIAEENNMYLLYEWLDGEEGDEDHDPVPAKDHK